MSFLGDFLSLGKKAADEPTEQDKMEEIKPDTDAAVAKTAASEAQPAQVSDPDAPRDRELEMQVADKLREIFDPEIPVNIYELGLIYDLRADMEGNVHVTMTLTTPHCPVAESMPSEVEMKVRDVPGINDVKVDLVWDPPWDMTMLSEAGRLELGLM